MWILGGRFVFLLSDLVGLKINADSFLSLNSNLDDSSTRLGP